MDATETRVKIDQQWKETPNYLKLQIRTVGITNDEVINRMPAI